MSQQTISPSAQPLTLEQATKAFEQWESDYRADPAKFFTLEEVATMASASLSEMLATYFMAYLRQVSMEMQGGAA